MFLTVQPLSWMSGDGNGFVSSPRGCTMASVGDSRWDCSLVGYMDSVVFVWIYNDLCRGFDMILITGGLHGLCCFCVDVQ